MLAARPDRLYEVRPQDRVLRRTVEQNVDAVTFPSLDVRTRLSKCPRSFLSVFHRRLVESRPPQLAESFVPFSQDRVQQRLGPPVVDNPVPSGSWRGGARGGLQGSRARQNSTANLKQIDDIPDRRGVPDFLPNQSSTASSSSRLRDDADGALQGFLALFPVRKKVRSWVRTRARICSPESSPSTRRACVDRDAPG